MNCKRIFLAAASALCLALFSCSKNPVRLSLWTNNVEFVSYAELFNASQDRIKVVAYYHEIPTEGLSAKDGQKAPDILAGSFLQAGIEKKYFVRLDSLLKKNGPLQKEDFYEALLRTGQKDGRQYLLPVSFNLPALVFYSGNYELLKDAAMLSFDDIKSLSKKFNAKNKDGTFSAMGFGPLWSKDFLYLVFKDKGVFFSADDASISVTENAFGKSADYIKEWVGEVNEGPKNEQDFAFKYLYMPFYNQVQNGRCLFLFASSRDVFPLPADKARDLDFRWICDGGKIQIEDDIVSAGVCSKSANKAAAKEFIVWLLDEKTQRKILDRKFKMNLEKERFGIAGGFSALRTSTERAFPLYYAPLISAPPVERTLFAPQAFPENWQRVKERVVEPFILDSCDESAARIKTLSERYSEFLASEDK